MAHPRPYALQRYRNHRRLAQKRGIPFLLTFEEWDTWWLANGVERNIPRIHNKNILCMCRLGDRGAYELSNIYCATMSQNTKDRNFNCAPYGHPSQKIETPLGIFPSIRAAERAHKCGSGAISYRLKNNFSGYRYL